MTAHMDAAYEINGRRVDRADFYSIACDPRRSVAVEACAGAGKTWMLVSRMVRALLDGAAPHEILAITFTKKAAGEMRERLQEWLRDFSQADDATLRRELQVRGVRSEITEAQLQTLRGLHTALLTTGRPVQVRTFHSWFAALLRSAPLGLLHQLGLPTTYELLENDSKAIAQVWRRFHARIAQDAAARADYLQAVAVYGRHGTLKALEAAIHKRTEFALADAHGVVDRSVAHFTVQFPAMAAWEHPADRLHSEPVQSLLWASAKALGGSSVKTCVDAGVALELALSAANTAGMYKALFTDSGSARKLSEKVVGIETVREAQALLTDIQAALDQHEAWQHQQRMARLSRGLLQDYAHLKRERGWIDMADLEQTALRLLSDEAVSGWVQERLDARIKHLLIDEFQDTNPLQWQALFAWLEGYGGNGPKPGVFVVGDPKQSIYRFRRAEPQVFQAAKTFVREGLHGDVLSCDHTRRNAQAIIQLVNTAMLGAQAADEFSDYRAHTSESVDTGAVLKLPRIGRPAKAQADAEDAPEWRDSLTTPRHEAEDTIKTLECRQAAAWLAGQLTSHGGAWRAQDIMVLARRRERLGLMQQELAALGIAAQQPEKNELGDMPEAQDLVALLDVLVSPTHDLSLARVLKSPVFGASDADLVTLALAHRRARSAARAADPEAASPAWLSVLFDPAEAWPAGGVLSGAAQRLQHWQTRLLTQPVHDALSAMFEEGAVLARYASASPPVLRESVLANLRALLNAALQVDGGRYTTAYSLVRALRQEGNKAPVRADAAAVRLLTIHGAKGLEAPVVLMLDTDAESARPESMGILVDWPGEDAYPRKLVFMASESRPPACSAAALSQEQAARQREELNALYVALTRTRQTLVLSSMAPHREREGSWWKRLEGLATACEVPQAPGGGVEPPVAVPGSVSLKVLPRLSLVPNRALAPDSIARVAINSIAKSSPAAADSLESRVGQAMHRLLEWVPLQDGPVRGGACWSAHQRAQVARAFSLAAGDLTRAEHMAQGILGGEGAWAWQRLSVAWHANEVALTHEGRTLRLDRLVQDRATSAWWVLDFKSTATPQDQPDLRAQLREYRTALQRSQPGSTVRTAFLTPQGRLIELFD
ncbi:UvrD-helicase domain-containing protein [Rhodoferax sp.]|uniref:UvrD-helicase domain-containing protein n=1 Tax=Rhodoferax sp. TaxID=50421 RepID=UPI0025CC341F|nr:UvrD-helicase domain-containing protein [Rhodoferax sp.]